MASTITPPKTLGGPKARAHIRARDEAKIARERARVWVMESDEEKRGGRDETAKEFAALGVGELEWAAILEGGVKSRPPPDDAPKDAQPKPVPTAPAKPS